MKAGAPLLVSRGALALMLMALILSGIASTRPVNMPTLLPLILSVAGFILSFAGRFGHEIKPSLIAYKRFGIASLCLILLGLLYLFNPSHRWEEGFGLVPLDHLAWLPATTTAEATKATGMVLLTGLAMAGCCMGLSHRRVRGFYLAVALAGIGMALWVLNDRLTPRPFPVFPVTGIFTSENHYAAFANLALPAALGLGWSASQRARSRGRVGSAAPVFVMGAGVIAASIVISGSRAGQAIALSIFVAFGFLLFRQSIWWSIAAERINPRIVKTLLVLLLLAGLGMAVVFAMRISGELSFRGIMIADSFAIWRDRPWWGIGPGAFPHVMPYYQSESLGDRVVLHAHNEPVQFLAEYGVLGGATLVGAIALMLLPAFRRRTWTPEFSVAALALGGCSLHALVDFTFRHEVIALLAFAYAGVVAGQPLREALAG